MASLSDRRLRRDWESLGNRYGIAVTATETVTETELLTTRVETSHHGVLKLRASEVAAIAREFGVSANQIGWILIGKRREHVGGPIWERTRDGMMRLRQMGFAA